MLTEHLSEAPTLACMDHPTLLADPIRTARLLLEPLRVEHAVEAAAAFDDIALHTYTGGAPATAEHLHIRYARQIIGLSPDGSQTWLNWMLRRVDTAELMGTVQATVVHDDTGGSAELSWMIATSSQGQGYAREAASAMVAWLQQRNVCIVVAHIHPEHRASAGVARALGMEPTGSIVDGEERWSAR